MDQNQTVDNDLQKAIDNITNDTNVDPIFSDPVAAPSSIPEGDTGELGEPIGPFPEPKLGIVTPAPEPIAPFEPINVPELSTADTTPPTDPAAITTPELTSTSTNISPKPTPKPVTPEPAPIVEETTTIQTDITTPSGNLSTRQVKEAALRDLIPLLDHLNMTASQKFNICRNIFEDLRDYTVLEQAYRAASEIADSTERAEALLYLVESIDKM